MRTGMALACVVILAQPAIAQETRLPRGATLTLSEAIASARAWHPALTSSEARVAAAEASVQEVASARLPALASEAHATRHAQPMVVAPLHGFDPSRPPTFDRTLIQAHVSLHYTLFDGGARSARLGRERALLDAASASAQAAEQELLADVTKAYLRAGASRELVAAQASRAAALEQERERVERLLAQGRAARVVLLRAEAALSRARAESISAEQRADLAVRRLARLMGVAPGDIADRPLVALPVRTAPVSARDTLVAAATDANPEVSRARSRVAAALAVVDEARSLWLPTVRLAGRYSEYGSGAGSFEGEWQGGVQFSYPLFTGGARLAAADRASAEFRAVEGELHSVELRVADAVDAALAALLGMEARVVALEAAVAQGIEVARIERLALDAGAGLQTDYIAAEAELLSARAALSEARADLLTARVDLARVTGALTPAWIAQNLESPS